MISSLLLMLLSGCSEEPEKSSAMACETRRPTVRRMTALQYQNTLKTLLEVNVDHFPTSTVGKGFRTYAQANRVSATGAETILEASEKAAEAVDWRNLSQCDDDSDPNCPSTWLTALAESAFRRPPTPQEIIEITGLIQEGISVDEGVRLGIMVILNAPPFLYLDAMHNKNTGHALAARMSYFLWNDSPDLELLQAVKDDKLATRMDIRNQALRLIESPKVIPTIQAFHEDWLGLSALDDMYKDPDRYPTYDDHLAAAFKIETQLFITEVFWMQEPTWKRLLSANESWVNPVLSDIYEIAAPDEGWNRIQFDVTKRPGILTRGAFLSAQANAASSSPVKRGAFVLRQLLCRDLEPPADVDMELLAPSVENPTIRDRLAVHSIDPNCRGCHDQLDPAGFAFEHFGGMGEWRSHWEGGQEVDASGRLTIGEFDGADELMALLIEDQEAQACYVEKWVSYAIGRPIVKEDKCAIDKLTSRFKASGGHLPNLLADIAISPFMWAEP